MQVPKHFLISGFVWFVFLFLVQVCVEGKLLGLVGKNTKHVSQVILFFVAAVNFSKHFFVVIKFLLLLIIIKASKMRKKDIGSGLASCS